MTSSNEEILDLTVAIQREMLELSQEISDHCDDMNRNFERTLILLKKLNKDDTDFKRFRDAVHRSLHPELYP